MIKVETLRKYVWVTADFEGLHHWPTAPDPVKFLKEPHRHVFKVKMWVEVQGSDREVEFILLKRRLNDFLNDSYAWPHVAHTTYSCEQMAEEILKHFNATMVSVSEDGENGALVMVANERIISSSNQLMEAVGGRR
jgi:flagellar biosynthesis component FlhA